MKIKGIKQIIAAAAMFSAAALYGLSGIGDKASGGELIVKGETDAEALQQEASMAGVGQGEGSEDKEADERPHAEQERLIEEISRLTASVDGLSKRLDAIDFSALGAGEGGLININTADADKLMELPGIGEAKAESIIKYREETGGFSSIEEIMNISGIKEAAFEKLKDLIIV